MRRILAVMLLAQITVALSYPATAARDAAIRGLDVRWPISDKVTSSIVTYQTAGDETFRTNLKPPVTGRARFNAPKTASAANKVPAVIYVHGTAGVDGRGAFNAFALNEAGIATLEIDMWGARHLEPGPPNRRKLQPTEPFALGAALYLAGQPMIDAGKIGIEGESMGGGITLRMASRKQLAMHGNGDIHFAAHLAFYPNCTEFATNENLRPMTGAPIHILVGDNDEDSSVEDCQAVAHEIGAGLTIYPGATHQWDEQRGHTFSFKDDLANRGKGGIVHVTPSPETAAQSRAFEVTFFKRAFGME